MKFSHQAKTENNSLKFEQKTSSRIPFAYLFDDETIETKSGNLLQILEIKGLPTETMDDELIDHEKHNLNRLLINIADSTTTLYFHTIRRKENKLLTGTYKSQFIQELNNKWNATLAKKQFFVNTHYITIIKKPPMGKIRKIADIIRMISTQFIKKEREKYREKVLHDLNKISNRLIQTLSHYQVKKLSSFKSDENGVVYHENISFLANLINLELLMLVAPQSDLASYLPNKRLFFDSHSGTIALRNGKNQFTYAAILSIKHYKANSHAGLLDGLMDVPCEFILAQSISFFDKQLARTKIKEESRNKIQSDDQDSRDVASIHQALDELSSNEAVSGYHHFSLLCMANSLDELDTNVGLLEVALNNIGIIAIREDRGLKASFFAMLPGNQAYITQPAILNSKHIAAYTGFHNAMIGKFNGNRWGEAITVLETVSGSPYYMNFHVRDVGNTVIIGPQGSGKTVIEIFLLLLSMKYGGKLVVLDYQEGLKASVLASDGRYQLIRPGQFTGFAPFQIKDTLENRYFLSGLLKKIAAISSYQLSDDDELTIKTAVDIAFTLPREQRILRNIVPSLGIKKSGSLRMQFEAWVNDGQYAWVFDNEVDTFTLNAEIIGWDMTHIIEDSYTRTPVYYYLFHQIGAMLDGQRMRVVIADAAKALDDDFYLAQIKEWNSTPRKKECFPVMDIQAPEDVIKSKIGKKIIQESATQLYSGNPKASYEDYVTHFGLTPKEYDIIKNIDINSRFFLLKQGQSSVVVRADLSQFKDELSVLSGRTKNNEIIDQLCAQYGHASQNWLSHYYQAVRAEENK